MFLAPPAPPTTTTTTTTVISEPQGMAIWDFSSLFFPSWVVVSALVACMGVNGDLMDFEGGPVEQQGQYGGG